MSPRRAGERVSCTRCGAWYDTGRFGRCPACHSPHMLQEPTGEIDVSALGSAPAAPNATGNVAGNVAPPVALPPTDPSQQILPTEVFAQELDDPTPVDVPAMVVSDLDERTEVMRGVGDLVRPVVGWLVCIKGPNKGRDFRLSVGQNAIGRDASNHVQIEGDRSISRVNQAVVVFDPRNATYLLRPGTGSAITRRRGFRVDQPTPLAAFDSIELGDSEFVFVPLCGQRFSWS